MEIQTVGGTTTASGANDERSEYDKWKLLEEAQNFNNKVASEKEFIESKEMSVKEYKKQGEEAGEKGFGAILDEKMKN